jgi:hypothetical protein
MSLRKEINDAIEDIINNNYDSLEIDEINVTDNEFLFILEKLKGHNLKFIYINNNKLSYLPLFLNNFEYLEKIFCSGNKDIKEISNLNVANIKCKNIEKLRIKNMKNLKTIECDPDIREISNVPKLLKIIRTSGSLYQNIYTNLDIKNIIEIKQTIIKNIFSASKKYLQDDTKEEDKYIENPSNNDVIFIIEEEEKEDISPEEIINEFDIFYKENIDKCIMKINDTFPVNQTKLIQWVDRMIDISNNLKKPYIKDFALCLSKNIQHISFQTFYEKIFSIAMEIKEFVYDKKTNSNIILYIPETIEKSHLWVSLLYFKVLRKYINCIVFNIKEIYTILDNNEKSETVIIFPDDASYSGSQLFQNLKIFLKRRDRKPSSFEEGEIFDREEIYDINTNIKKTNQFDDKKITCYVALGYISQETNRILKNNFSKIKIPLSTTVFKNFKDIFIEQYNKENYNLILKDHIFNKTILIQEEYITTLYFDHKLASGISTFQRIYALGMLYTDYKKIDTKDYTIGSLIHNCENSYKNVKIGDIINTSSDKITEKDITDLKDGGYKMCPKSFYKSIKYTIFNQEFDNTLESKYISYDLNITEDFLKKIINYI